MKFPSICPEVPVASLAPSLAYYRDKLGFTVDWSDEELGLAGLSREDARMFMPAPPYRSVSGSVAPVVMWVNLSNRAEVDPLHAAWTAGGAGIVSPPEAKPYKLYEFYARDIDGNLFRVFYDFGWEERAGA
jgi:hypothetical protein